MVRLFNSPSSPRGDRENMTRSPLLRDHPFSSRPARWKDQEVQALCGFIFRLVAVFSTGLYVWYWLLSLHKVEWALLTRRMRFTWAHISYFTARYCHLITVLTVIISTNVEQILLNCGSSAVLKVAAILGNIALAAASTNLGLRAVAMWQDIRFIKIGLAVICAVHGLLAVIMGLESVQAKWNSVHSVCMVLTSKSQPQLVSFYTFTLAWDLIILVFTLAGMCRQRLPTRSPLWATIVSQGLGYVLISCATCIPMMIMVSLNLNNTMNVILTAPGCTIW
ncbi:uncharacterized protein PHACADRAFT_214905 [Phanerochaete carnosa HHB-10118-sp]|uniref:Uncharacterized protein n=1 Tax=Phanerochaete carnosa (strain HHB-10118-sp) TaxID=650164 RepID=K5VND7_PHACS|nr:uncharacterized protein PHACADRAFT_214905 [Phanerochaete carnosa HHB-10118-sp]EKM48210.1 hypothetical protein PHACADRAFT_214905 [Phanerochaete carnosa HHB-10118-sp]